MYNMFVDVIQIETYVYDMLFDFIHIENLGVGDLKLATKHYDACNTCPQKKSVEGGEGSEAGTGM